MGTNPFDQFDTTAADSLGRPVIIKPPAAVSQTDQYHPITPQERQSLGLGAGIPAVVSGTGKPEVIGGDKTNYRPMSADEKTANHLSPDAPWLMGSNGDFKLPDGFKPADDASKAVIQKQEANDGFDALIQGVHRARAAIGDADTPIGNTATGWGYSLLHNMPSSDAAKLDGFINQEIRGNIFLKRLADLKAANDSPNGGTGIGRIMQAEIPLITGAIGTLDPAKLGKQETLNSLAQIERSALRSKAINNGENPDDPQVQQKYGIGALPATPGGDLPGGPASPIANGGGGDQGPTLTPSSGGTRAVIDPAKQALGAKIVGLVQKGADRNTIMGFAVGADPTLRSDPKFRSWVDQAIQYRAEYPKAEFPIDPGFYTREVPLSPQEKVATAIGSSAPGAAAINAANGATAGNLGGITGNRNDVNRALMATAGQHPLASLLGTMAGGGAATLGGEGLLGGAGIAQGALRIGLADMLYGGSSGASNPDGNTLGNIVKGAVVAPIAGFAGNKAASGLGSAVEGVTSPTVSYVAKQAPLTIGQAVGQSGTVGKAVKGIEDRMSGIPIVGDAVRARRIEGLQAMNSSAFNRALEPIGDHAGGKFGEEAVQQAQDAVGNAFDKALKGKTAAVDTPFITQAASAKRAIQALPPSVAKDVENHVDTAIKDYFDPHTLTISGENMQGLLRDLQQVKKSYQADPAGHRIGKAIDQVTGSIEGMFQRQAPEVMPAYNAAKKSFKRVSTLEDAVLRAKNSSEDGNALFTPAQLGMADRANTVNFGGKHAAAAGKGEFHDFQRNAQEVLPSKVPDSGTAGRMALMAAPATLATAGAGAGAAGGDSRHGAEAGLTLGTLLALAYSKTGQRGLVAAALRRPGTARTAGSAIQKVAPMIGHGTGAAAAIRANRD